MSHSSGTPTHAVRDTSGALDELLQAEREIAAELQRADEEAARIMDDARAEQARRRDAALKKRSQALAALEARMRAHAAAEESETRERAETMRRLFDDASVQQVERLADDMLAELYGLRAEGVP